VDTRTAAKSERLAGLLAEMKDGKI